MYVTLCVFSNSHTAVQVGIENPSYLSAEDEGLVTVCATTNGTLDRHVIVTLSTVNGTATG